MLNYSLVYLHDFAEFIFETEKKRLIDGTISFIFVSNKWRVITTAIFNDGIMKLWAVRGATTITQDTAFEVLEATRELLTNIFDRNQILPEDVVSIIFTVTPDIQSEFPAVAARHLGLNSTPLLCMQEIPKTGALPCCIRVLIHFYTRLNKNELKPVYLRKAISLRPDLANTEDPQLKGD